MTVALPLVGTRWDRILALPARPVVTNPLKDSFCHDVLAKLVELLAAREKTYREAVSDFKEKYPINLRGLAGRAKAEFIGDVPAYTYIENSVGPKAFLEHFRPEQRVEVIRALFALHKAKMIEVFIIGGQLAPRRSMELTDLARTLFSRDVQPDFVPKR